MTRGAREARLPIAEAPAEGAVRLLEIGGLRVGLFRVADAFHALADRCPHRGAPLCAGRVAAPIGYENGEVTLGLHASVLRCPWHKWEFDIATGRCLVDEKLRVRRYAVRIDDEEIVVTLDRPTPA
ncbi:MAG: Rieske (2Fe-2S) protein [Gaiellaceae bacterium]